MSKILNPSIYEKAKQKADLVHKKHSAYKSMYIQSEYKKMGGKYSGKKTSSKGVKRWNDEQWIQVKEYLKTGKKVACGYDDRTNKVCRPFKRINKDTPITLPELLKIHSKEDLLKLCNKKIKDPEGRVFWKTKKFVPSL